MPLAFAAAKDDTAHCFFGSWKSPWMHEVLARHFAVKGAIVWDKKVIGLGHYLRSRWELIYFCAKGSPPRPARAEADVWPVARLQRTIHPCEKPVDLLRRLVRLAAPAGGIVCDCFAGIASTGVAAIAEGRRFLGFEIDSRFVELGRGRLNLDHP